MAGQLTLFSLFRKIRDLLPLDWADCQITVSEGSTALREVAIACKDSSEPSGSRTLRVFMDKEGANLLDLDEKQVLDHLARRLTELAWKGRRKEVTLLRRDDVQRCRCPEGRHSTNSCAERGLHHPGGAGNVE